MITLAQIKAARALLGWTQEDLAQRAGLSLPAINNLERGLTSPRRETLSAISNTLQQAGIEFLDTSGVRIRSVDIQTELIDGPDWLARYDADIISQMTSAEDEICQYSCDERNWMIHGSTSNHHYIDHRSKIGFQERILVPETGAFVSNLRRVYRTLPPAFFGSVSYQIYADRTAFIHWNSRQILLIKSAPQATALKAQYELLWANARPYSDAAWDALEKWTYGQKGKRADVHKSR